MRVLVTVLGLTMAWGPAWGQTGTPQATTNPTTPSDTVTFAELEGLVVEATVVMQRVVQRDGREFPAKFQSDLRFVVGPGDKLEGTMTSTAYSARGVRRGKPQTFSPQVEQPKEIKLSGGGHSVWIFMQGTLTHLRTFKGGAYKRDIAFARGAKGFTCSAQETFAREDGVGSLVMNSPIDNAPMRVVSSKQISSTCRMTKRQ